MVYECVSAVETYPVFKSLNTCMAILCPGTCIPYSAYGSAHMFNEVIWYALSFLEQNLLYLMNIVFFF